MGLGPPICIDQTTGIAYYLSTAGTPIPIIGRVYQPEATGAVGDGITDDTAVIQALFNSGAKVIYLAGTYAITDLTLFNLSGIRIFGPGTLKITGAPVNGTHGLAVIQCDRIILEDFTIDGQNASRGGAAGANNLSFYGCTNCSSKNVKSINSAGDGVYINRAAGSVVINGVVMSAATVISSNLRFENCLFDYAYRNDITVVACEGYLFDCCVISNAGKSSAGTVAPSAGVDLEPNDTVQYFARNGIFRLCRWFNNTGGHLLINGRVFETTVDGGVMDTGSSYGISNSGARTLVRNLLIKSTGVVGGSPRMSILNQSQTGSRASLIIEGGEILTAIFGGITQNSYADLTIRNHKVADGANFALRLAAGSDPGDGDKGFTDVRGFRAERLFSSSPPSNAAYIMGGSYDGRLSLNGVTLDRNSASGTPIEIGMALLTATPTDIQEISDFNALGTFATTDANGFNANVLRNNRLNSVVTALLNMTGSATYDPPSIGAGLSATTTITVTGAALGDKFIASFSLSLAGLNLNAYVSAANTVTCLFSNPTAGAIDLASGTLSVSRIR
jgi:hypothetical protein